MKRFLIMIISTVFLCVSYATPGYCIAEYPDAVVYRDKNYPVSWITHGAAGEVAEFAQALGMKTVDAEGLASWLKETMERGAGNTLIIMANDVAPAQVAGAAPDADALLRKYLDAGGSVIWMADVPFYFIGSENQQKEKWDYLGGRGVLGIDTVGNWKGRSQAAPTDEGKAWGLVSTWTSVRAVKPQDVTTVLAADADGNASAWTRQYKQGALGFVRIWDGAITSFTDDMGQDLYRIAARVLPRLSGIQRRGDIYLFQPSDYYPLVHIRDQSAVREALISVFDVNPPQDARYELVIAHDGRMLHTMDLFAGPRVFFRRNIEVPLLHPQQELMLVGRFGDKRETLSTVQLNEPALIAEFEFNANPRINPVDLGRVLIPNDTVLLNAQQKLDLNFQLIFPGESGTHKIAVNARAENRDGDVLLQGTYEDTLVEGSLKPGTLSLQTAELAPGKYRLIVTVSQGGSLLYEEKKWLFREDTPVPARDFGAFYTSLGYDGPVPVYDRKSKEWSTAKWDDLWIRGPHKDIVVAFPNGGRFVFWRGSSNVPFWASAANVGLTYEWLEAAWGRGGLTDCIEPLQDKKCMFSRPHIIANSPARAVIDWRYALIDLEYIIADEEWAEETYVFYPDGFGVRKAKGSFVPMTWHEANEFIVFIPSGINPFDIFPADAVSILSLDGTKSETISYPQPSGKWEADTAAVFRVHISRDDASTPIMVSRRFKNFIVQYDGWKQDGRYISPSYWGVHYPVTRGYPTTVTAPPGWRERPGHASLTAIDTEPFSRKMVNSNLEQVTWAWLIGNTDLPDDELLVAARSWAEPLPVEVWEGAKNCTYAPFERGYTLTSDGSGTVKVKFTGAPAEKVFNPVFLIDNFSSDTVEVLVNGNKPAVYKTSLEHTYTNDTLVVWIGESVPGDAIIRIKDSGDKIF